MQPGVSLIAEEHLQVGAAIPKHQRVVQLAERLSHAQRADEGAIVNVRIFAGWTSHHQQLRCGALRQLYKRVVPSVAFHRHVVTRTEAFDQS